jgi:TPP-dependent pyruvate/acetoin dehydrogenase alpha subunit
LHDSDLAIIEQEIAREIDASVTFAEAGTWEPVTELTRDVVAGAR